MGSPLWGAAKTNGNSPGRIASSTKGPQDTYRLTSAKYESSLKVYQIHKKTSCDSRSQQRRGRERNEKSGERERVIYLDCQEL